MILEDLTPEQIDRLNERNLAKNHEDFKAFKADIAQGVCPMCKQGLDYFDEAKPCLHWLLMPQGIRKRDFGVLFRKFTYDRIQGFLRWYVNSHKPFQGINDLREENDPNKMMALTIKHENLEWSFSCSRGCLEGKDGGNGPHYHFQMRVDGRPFIDYTDHHIPLNDYELWCIDVDLGNNPKVVRADMYGLGMQGALEDIEPEDLLKKMRRAEEPEDATFNVSSLIVADPGKTISGDALADIFEESKRTGKPIHQLIQRLEGVTGTIYVEPGDGVPKSAQRTLRKRGKKKRKK